MSMLKITLRPEVMTEIKQAIFKETRDCFILDIVPEATRNSPVTPDGLVRNVEMHKKRPGGTGTNRRSLDANVEMTRDGVTAELYSQSGYGGYLEVGTSKMRPQPYMFPAAMKYLKVLPLKIKAALKKLS